MIRDHGGKDDERGQVITMLTRKSTTPSRLLVDSLLCTIIIVMMTLQLLALFSVGRDSQLFLPPPFGPPAS